MKRKIKITESILNRIVKESVNRVINEGVSDDNPIEKWIYWCYNYDNPEEWMGIFKGAPAEHFMQKFSRLRGDMNRFYLELDSRNRPILIDYVMNNY